MSRDKREKRRVTVAYPVENVEIIDQIASEQGISVSAVMNQVLFEYLTNKGLLNKGEATKQV